MLRQEKKTKRKRSSHRKTLSPQEERNLHDSGFPSYTLYTRHSYRPFLPAAKELSLRAFHLLWAQLAGTHFGVSKLEGDEKGNPTFLPGERIKMKRFFLFSSARSSWHLS